MPSVPAILIDTDHVSLRAASLCPKQLMMLFVDQEDELGKNEAVLDDPFLIIR